MRSVWRKRLVAAVRGAIDSIRDVDGGLKPPLQSLPPTLPLASSRLGQKFSFAPI
jgi:hypothetical protein